MENMRLHDIYGPINIFILIWISIVLKQTKKNELHL